MDFDSFVNLIFKDVTEDLSNRGMNVELDVYDMNKLQGSYTGIVARIEGTPVRPVINLDAKYAQYQKTGDYFGTCKEVTEMMLSEIENSPQVDMEALRIYEKMKTKLIMALVPTKKNHELLEKMPHMEIEDMSVIYQFKVSVGAHMGTITITNDLMERYGITDVQLHEDAVANASFYGPVVIRSLAEVLGANLPFGMSMEECPLWMATNISSDHGAGVLAYPDFFERAQEKVGTNFYVLPSSIHELLLVPDDGNLLTEDLKAMVEHVNRTAVDEKDWLSDNVYHYSGAEKIFERAENYDRRIAEKSTDTFLKGKLMQELTKNKESIKAQEPAAAKTKRGNQER